MKTTLFCILLLLSGIVSAQTIDHPPFKARSGSISNITRIERTPENTRVYIHAIFRPHWWIMEDGDTYLEDAATGKKYLFKSAEGIELKKEVYMPDSGTMDYVLVFEPLPSETQTIHFLNPTDPEGNIYDISLVPQKRKDSSPLATIKGNWFKTDGSGSWEYGVYDSISILNNRIYTNANIRKKGKRIEMTLKDRESQEEMTLSFTPQKDGTCKIQQKGAEELVYSKERTPITQVAAEPDFKQFFRQDSTYLQGYINGYDPRLGFDTGLIYLSNELTREDYPTVIQIAPNGSFSCRFIINHPIESSVVLGHNWIPFYIEPGQTLTMYIDWEAVMARSRARDYYYPLHNVHYMGSTAYIGKALKYVDDLFVFRYEDFSKMQKELTPAQFVERCEPMFRRWSEQADSLVAANRYVGRAARLVRNTARISQGYKMFDFVMNRSYLARENKDNEVLKVKEDSAYYNFLRQMPLNDSIIVADKNFSSFINRLEYMDFARAMGDTTTVEMGKIAYKYPEKSVLTYLKKNGVVLTPEQEKMRKDSEDRAGKTVTREISELIAETKIWEELREKYKDLFEAYRKENEVKNDVSVSIDENQKAEDEKIMRINQFFENQREKSGRLDTIVGYVPLVSQIIALRSLPFDLKQLDREGARSLLDKEKQLINHPFMLAEAERLYAQAFPLQNDSTYALPEGPATEILRNIIKAHAGKALFIDFWATFCGPCRSGIEHTAGLRQQYKDHPDFQFIYITSDRESPEKTYNEYVEKNLKGEACYRIPQADYNYLRQLFHFNGIPHYEWIEKDGTVLRNSPGTYNLEKYLKKRFGNKD